MWFSPVAIRSASSTPHASSARSSSAAFDATDVEHLERFFEELPTPIDHVMVTPLVVHTTCGWRTSTSHRGAATLTRSSGCRATSLAASSVRCARAERSCSSAERAVAGWSRVHSSQRSPPRCRRSPKRWRSSSHPSASTLLRPDSSTRRCGVAARRSARRASRAAPHHAADQTSGRPGRHRRARRPPQDKHSDHRSNLRHRRRPAARRGVIWRRTQLLRAAPLQRRGRKDNPACYIRAAPAGAIAAIGHPELGNS